MSIFNDKALKGVAEAAAKIMAETSHGSHPKTPKEKSLAALAHPKDKITHKDVLVGRGVLKKEEVEQLDEVGDTPAGRKALGSYVTKAIADKSKDRTKGLRKATSRMYKDNFYGKKNEEVEQIDEKEGYGGSDPLANRAEYAKRHGTGQVYKKTHPSNKTGMTQAHAYNIKRSGPKGKLPEEVETTEEQLDEAFPTVADAKKRMDAGKTATGSVTKTATGLVHKRDYKDDDDEDDTPKKKGGYGARQNYKRSTRVNESLSFTEMLELYNEHGLKVLAPIETEEMDIDGTTIEVIDADKVNGVVDTIVEEPSNEQFTKELKDQEASAAGKKPQPKVAAGKTTGVKNMPEEVEHLDELSKGTLSGYIKKAQKVQIKDYQDAADTHGYGANPERRKGLDRSEKIHRAVDKLASKKTNEEVEHLDELSKGTLGSYVKKATTAVSANSFRSGYVKGSDTGHNLAVGKKGQQKDHSADSSSALGTARKRQAGIGKAVERLTREETELDERTLTSGETEKKEKYVKSMKKGLSGFKQRYGERAKSVMYATATKMAKKD